MSVVFENQEVKDRMINDVELDTLEKKLEEYSQALAETLVAHIERAYKILSETTNTQHSPDECNHVKFRMIHALVDELPSRIGPKVADIMFPDGWNKVAAMSAASELINLIMKLSDESELEPHTTH